MWIYGNKYSSKITKQTSGYTYYDRYSHQIKGWAYLITRWSSILTSIAVGSLVVFLISCFWC